jgi:hypothetical protein
MSYHDFKLSLRYSCPLPCIHIIFFVYIRVSTLSKLQRVGLLDCLWLQPQIPQTTEYNDRQPNTHWIWSMVASKRVCWHKMVCKCKSVDHRNNALHNNRMVWPTKRRVRYVCPIVIKCNANGRALNMCCIGFYKVLCCVCKWEPNFKW